MGYEKFLILGNEYLDKKKFDKSIQCYDQVLALDANNLNCLYLKSYSLFYLNKFEEALENLNRVILLGSTDYKVFYFKGRSLFELKKLKLLLLFSIQLFSINKISTA